jgi:hypothetical protein
MADRIAIEGWIIAFVETEPIGFPGNDRVVLAGATNLLHDAW